MIDLSLCLGKVPNRVAYITTFMVINQASAYKIILRGPTFNECRAIHSTYYMVMKFLITKGVEVVKGDYTR